MQEGLGLSITIFPFSGAPECYFSKLRKVCNGGGGVLGVKPRTKFTVAWLCAEPGFFG